MAERLQALLAEIEEAESRPAPVHRSCGARCVWSTAPRPAATPEPSAWLERRATPLWDSPDLFSFDV